MYWRNDKNRQLYQVINQNTINCTNNSNDERMVLYKDKKGNLYVREYSEFFMKFEQTNLKHF